MIINRKHMVGLIYFQILFNFIIKFFIFNLGFPAIANYITDIITVLLYLASISKVLKCFRQLRMMRFLSIITLMLVCSVIGLMLNRQELHLYFWGMRNNYRFFAFFISCVLFLKKDDLKRFFNLLYIMLGLNIIICSYQYYIQHFSGDFLGGLFGTEKGCNGMMNIFICILATHIFLEYLIDKKIKIWKVIYVAISTTYLAALAELKVFFFELPFIIFLIILLTRPNKRTILIVLGSIVALIIGFNIFTNIFPNQVKYFQIEQAMEYLGMTGSGYASIDDLNRFTALPQINNTFFRNDIMLKLFGLGLGNCEVSNVSFFQSKFSSMYSYLHYTYFSHAFMFIENGYTGLILYILFFILVFIYAKKVRKKCPETQSILIFAQIFSVVVLVNIFYNNAMRAEGSGYLAYLCLSFPGIIYKEKV